MKKKPLVSILVSTRNSARYLRRCLESVKRQTYNNWELIIVDNYSTDRTLVITRKYTKKIYSFGPERSSQYNLAAAKAKGKYLYRIDSDFLLDKEVVAECVDKCEKEHWDAIAIHNTSDDSLGFWSKVRKLERDCYIDDDSVVAVRFMKRKVFKMVGGFDEKMFAGEDYDLHNKIVMAGYKWSRTKSKEVHLGEVSSLLDFARQCFRYGKNSVFYVEKHPQKGVSQMLARGSYFRHYKEIMAEPVLALGLLIMILVKYSVGGVGFLLASLGIISPNIERKNEDEK